MKFTPKDGQVRVVISCEYDKHKLISIKDRVIRRHKGSNSSIMLYVFQAAGSIGMFRFAVSDTGVGLSPEEQEKIFGEFTQFNKNELQGGGEKGSFIR